MAILFVFISFFSGALPISVWIARFILKKDLNFVGDGNPGAYNVLISGGQPIGIITLLLEISKAAIPVGISAKIIRIEGIALILITIAPILGHVFSPFLRFRGGKGLATCLGAWIGLSTWKLSVPAALGAFIGTLIFSTSAWAVVFSLVVILLVQVFWFTNPVLFSVWIFQVTILIWTHRAEFAKRPSLNPGLSIFFRRFNG